MRFFFPLKQVSLLVVLCVLVTAQSPGVVQSQRLETIPFTNADNEQAYLDLFAVALTKDTSARGYLVGYSKPDLPPGMFLSKLYGYKRYLVDARGIQPDRVVIIAGGVKPTFSTELWVVPNSTSAPTPDSKFNPIPTLPIKFDVVYPDCPPEFSLDLYELKDSLSFYADVLKSHPNVYARIVTYPGRHTSFRKMILSSSHTRTLLIRDYNIDGKRIAARAKNRHRDCSQIELWLTEAR